ncbi:MAG: glycosyltransferase [Desulfobacterales bacterium]|nr:glycosyltransferase [Desulfobacterales bacterium]
MNPAPIILFVYNRPWHTKQTVEALQKNELAHDSELFIYSDGPRNTEETQVAVAEVRNYLKSVDGFKKITITESPKNLGLAASVIRGVSEVVNKYGRVIVLEDDLVTSPYFLTFMNDALDVYQHEESVMHISGYMFPVDTSDLPETFFLRTASCWGWATWDRAWKHYRKNPQKLLGEFTKQKINRFNLDGVNNFWAQVERNEKGLINTWAVFWYATVFQMDGLCLHPSFSMVNNIGNDDTGVHCKQSCDFDTTLASKPIKYFEENIAESALAHTRTKEFFRTLKPPFLYRIFSAIRRRLLRKV